jgi:hypothetical protein
MLANAAANSQCAMRSLTPKRAISLLDVPVVSEVTTA